MIGSAYSLEPEKSEAQTILRNELAIVGERAETAIRQTDFLGIDGV